MNHNIAWATTIGVIALSIAGYNYLGIESPTAPLEDVLAAANATTSGGSCRIVGDDFSGVGWSLDPVVNKAFEDAAAHAIEPEAGKPDITMVYYNAQHDPNEILAALRKRGDKVGKIIGQTSHEGILDASGYHTAKTGVLGLMSMRSQNMRIGVGCASFDEMEPRQAAKLALQRALEDGGDHSAGERPSMILLCVTLPHEEIVLEALAEVTDASVPLIGGTAAGSVNALGRKKISNWSIIANDRVIHHGVAMAVFHSDNPIAWSYGGGFRRTSTSGIATKCQGRLIVEIDGKPAADVYNEWLGGRVYEAMSRGENIIRFCGLYPLCRYQGGTNQFICAWPSEETQNSGSLRTGSRVREGEQIYLSEGNWNLLLNHFANVPRTAMHQITDFQSCSGLFFYCGGALACLPPEAREQMSHLVNHSIGGWPWIGVFSWGEQGNIPGVGILHSNLSAGMILFPSGTTD
jgi:hypothetical protein